MYILIFFWLILLTYNEIDHLSMYVSGNLAIVG